MARRAAQPWYLRSHRGIAVVDFYVGGRRVRRSLALPYHPQSSSRAEARAAHEAAARYYADRVAGRVTAASGSRVLTSAKLEEAIVAWLDAIETPARKNTCAVYEGYARIWCAFADDDAMLADGQLRWADSKLTPFERLVADHGPEDYYLWRIKQVTRGSVRKELVAMFDFLGWAKRHKHIEAVPPRPKLPKNEPGVRKSHQRLAPVEITPEQAIAIVAAMPEWSSRSSRGDGRRFRVRIWAEFLWETGLRPSTVERLEVPTNFVAGARHLTITDADDKARYGRQLPLSARARAILEEMAPAHGFIFGRHDYRHFVKEAARKVLPEHEAKNFARYDFRHGRALAMLESSGNMPGVAYLLGHKQLTTTNKYLRPARRQGEAVVAAVDAGDIRQAGTVSILSPGTDPSSANTAESLVGASGFEPPTPRPPAYGDRGITRENPDPRIDSDPRISAEMIIGDLDSVAIPSPILAERAGALAVQMAVWDAFDLFSLLADDDDAQ